MTNNQLKASLLGQAPIILQSNIRDMCCRSERFQNFFDQHLLLMKPVLTEGIRGMMESIFMSDEEYQVYLRKLQEDNRELGSTFLLKIPELTANDVLQLNQNLYMHLMRTVAQLLETELGSSINKPDIIERLYLTFSTSDHSFLQGYLQLKDKQVFDLHHQKISLIGQMAAGMAHEIRNPLTSIKGFIHLIMEQMNKETLGKEDLKFYLEVCEEQMNSLESVVSNFLSLARNKSKQAPAEVFTLQSVMERLNVLAQFYALEKSVFFTYQLPESEIELYGSPSDLEQICLNIIRNAMDAVSTGGHGKVHVEAIYKEEQKVIHLVIQDNGQGMSSDMLSKIWNPFFTTKETGTGLGLAISRQLIEDMGGTIDIGSIEGEGTEVTITLPVKD
ncbi:PAS domain-containing sensor histidine kinase [Ammoniphilus sp. CFH 90114]|uniref:sensor histidine kinase n=1 Tax=Ammoniphilus sp. CFH 90114 TaxID=2493665 RepID=UPI00100DA92B|nr:HAMP domain-containing sensor histidine kinase [Ammoniphilus sp. CFH 90114]RXT07281.1 HAMP domain-containing histidine kinase [Ammoniphilus sp. CFH 90114]